MHILLASKQQMDLARISMYKKHRHRPGSFSATAGVGSGLPSVIRPAMAAVSSDGRGQPLPGIERARSGPSAAPQCLLRPQYRPRTGRRSLLYCRYVFIGAGR